MNPLDPKIWSAGLDYAEYRRGVKKNAAGFDAVYRRGDADRAVLDWLRRLPPLSLLVVAADWCPDVWQTLPQWARIAENLPDWDLRIYDRDRNPDLMAHFTWNSGAERVPVYAFYHQDRLQVWWSARSARAEAELQHELAGRSFGDLDPAERERLGAWFEQAYEERLRQANLDEILRLLAAFFHLEPPSRAR